MDPTPEQVSTFGIETRRRRNIAGLTAADVAAALTATLGRTIKHQSITAWERGEYAPQDLQTAETLDALLDAGGELLAILFASDLADRVRHLEVTMTEQNRQLRELRDLLLGGDR